MYEERDTKGGWVLVIYRVFFLYIREPQNDRVFEIRFVLPYHLSRSL